MARNRRSARAAGTRFERHIADYLARHVDDRIDRRAKTGARDKGDIGGIRLHGQRVVLEAKDCSTISLAGWMTETEAERINDGALFGAVVHKRRGKGNPGDQWVTMTVRDLAALLSGFRPTDEFAPETRHPGPTVVRFDGDGIHSQQLGDGGAA